MVPNRLKNTVAAAALLCCSCSINPLDAPENAVDDPRLLGSWEITYELDAQENDASQKFLHITRDIEGFPENVLLFTSVTYTEEGECEVRKSAGYVTCIGEHSYLNMSMFLQNQLGPGPPVWDEQKIISYIFMRYELVDEELQLYWIDTDRIIECIENGDLAGSTESEPGNLNIPQLEATSEELREYLAAGNTFFVEDPWCILERRPSADDLDKAQPTSGRASNGSDHSPLSAEQAVEAWQIIKSLHDTAGDHTPPDFDLLDEAQGEPLIELMIEAQLPSGAMFEFGFGYDDQTKLLHLSTHRPFYATEADHEEIMNFLDSLSPTSP